MSVVAKQLDGSMQLGTKVGFSPGHVLAQLTQLPQNRGTAPSQFSARVYCGQTAAHLSYC